MTNTKTKKTQPETEKSLVLSIVKAVTGKPGCHYISMREDLRALYQGRLVPLRKYQLSFAVPTKANPTSSLIFQDLEKLQANYTKLLKNLKMDWYLTIDTEEEHGTLEVFISLSSQTKSSILKN